MVLALNNLKNLIFLTILVVLAALRKKVLGALPCSYSNRKKKIPDVTPDALIAGIFARCCPTPPLLARERAVSLATQGKKCSS